MRHVQAFVHGRVPPNLEQVVTELVARSVVLVMTEPKFYNHLIFVQRLQAENWQLRQALIAYQRAEQVRAQRARTRKASGPVKKAAPRKAAAPRKTAAPKKAAPVRKTAPKKAATSNVRAFKRGASGR
jgi:hypothetical protein